MRPLRTYSVTALVLRIRNLDEADRVLTLFSAERGKVAAIARGARRARSKLAALQLFSLATLQLASGRTFDTITQSVIRLPFFALRADVRRFAYASYIAELTDALSEADAPSHALFELTVSAFSLLDRGDEADVLARGFELKLLDLSGYAPQLDRCIICAGALGAEPMAFLAEQGGVLCAQCLGSRRGMLTLHEETRAWLLNSRKAGGLAAVMEGAAPSAGARRELHHALRTYLQYHLERPLKSLEMLTRLERE